MRQASKAITFAAGLALVTLARVTEGQARNAAPVKRGSGTVTVAPGAQYEAGALSRVFLGGGWRDVWVTPVNAPVLNLATYAGGLKLEERGGGFHSLVLHLEEDKGWREYRFRSVDKFPMQGMPPELKGTAVGKVLQDQVSVLFPAAPMLVHPLHRAVGALHVAADLYVMGDSPRLEHVRDTVAGMLGTMELKGEEAPDDKPGFGGSRSIKGTEKFFEDLASSREHQPDEREFLAVRLIDFLINDTDRTLDNFDWARFGEKGAYTWRPIPRDRDQAFSDARGLLTTLVIRRIYPKQVAFSNKFPFKGLTYTSHRLDRRLLQRLTADDFHSVGLRVQRAVHDSVIAQVVAEMPREWRARTTADERIASVLRARRDRLPEVAMQFYRSLAREVDVRGTEESDRFDVVRHADGRVTVSITGPQAAVLIAERRADGRVVATSDGSVARPGERARGDYFQRTFTPAETKELRLYANGGDDIAVVRGAGTVQASSIIVRLIGGKGDDVLADSAGGSGTFLYDAEGTNRFLTSDEARVSTRPWKTLEPVTGFRFGADWKPDWGRSAGVRPVVDYNSSAGIILGVGPKFRQYGFRRLPHKWEAGANLLVGTGNGRLGLTVDTDYRDENSPLALRVSGQATQLEYARFYGYGNDTPELSRSESLVEQNLIIVEPTLVWQVGWRARESSQNRLRGDSTVSAGLRPLVGEIRVGTVAGWIDPESNAMSLLITTDVRGARNFGFAGAKLGVELDRTDAEPVTTSGWKLNADVAAYPPMFGLTESFGTATAGGSVYLPIVRQGPHLAIRARGALASGGYPVQFAPAVGGRSTLRGYHWHRYAGDAAVNGGAELRVPVGTVNFLVRSQLGVFALADAGRVWFDGSSDGGWHSGVGGGFWLSTLGRAVSVAYARGESGRLYLKSGLFY